MDVLVQPPATAPFYGPFISRSPCALSRLRLRAGLPCLASVWFGLVRFGSVWGFFYPSSLLSFLFRTSRGLRSAARISAPALPWEEWLNGDSLLLLLFLCSYITSNPHSSRAEPAESSGAVLRCHGPGIYTAIQPPALPAPKPRGFRY